MNDDARTFKVGDRVYLRQTAIEVVVVREIDKKGRLRVLHGTMEMEVPIDAVATVPRKVPATQVIKRSPEKRRSAFNPRLDLHGRFVDDAITQLEKHIDSAILAGISRLEIVHGIGSGKVKDAVHQYLRGSRHVERFEVDSRNPGATWVYL